MLDRTEEKELLPGEEIGENVLPDVEIADVQLGGPYGSRCFIFINREMPWIDAEVGPYTLFTP